MSRAVASILLVLVMFSPLIASGSQITASLEYAKQQDTPALPYRTAILSVDNQSGLIIGRTSFRNAAGGPLLHFDLTVPPMSADSFRVYLPATELEQSWQVAFASKGSSEPMASETVRITWPTAMVSEQPFVAPEVYEEVQDTLALWPAQWKALAVLGCVMMALILAGTLFIRPARLRFAAAISTVALAAAGAVLAVSAMPAVVSREIPDPQGNGTLMLLSSRRTVQWHNSDDGPIPLYRSRKHMQRDEDTTIDHRRGLTITLRPQEVRCVLVRSAQHNADNTAAR